MFSWPKTIQTGGIITITGRHSTPTTRKIARALSMAMGFAIMVHGCFSSYSIINRALVPVFLYCIPHLNALGAYCFLGIGQFFGGLMVGIAAEDKGLNLCGWLVRQRTTIRISADRVEVAGISSNRADAPVRFTNLYPQAVQIDRSEGRHTMLGSMEETASLRMFYGSNTILITTFLSAEKASRFALACNAALSRLTAPAPGFGTVSVLQLYQGDYVDALPRQQPATLPSPGNPMVRRR